MFSDKIDPDDKNIPEQEVVDNMEDDNDDATHFTNMRQQPLQQHFNMMHEGEIGSVMDEENNGNDLFSMLGDVKPTPHPNNNR